MTDLSRSIARAANWFLVGANCVFAGAIASGVMGGFFWLNLTAALACGFIGVADLVFEHKLARGTR